MTPQEIRDFIANFNSVDAYTRTYNEYAHCEVGPLCERILQMESALLGAKESIEFWGSMVDAHKQIEYGLNAELNAITKILEGNNQ